MNEDARSLLRPKQLIHWQDTLSYCSDGLAVGMIDTPLTLNHPVIQPSVSAGRITAENFIPERKRPSSSSHGTAVAGLLVGMGEGVDGLIPHAKLYAAGAFFDDEEAGGEPVTDTVSLLRSLDWLRANGVKIVNLSFTGPSDPLIEAAIEKSIGEGMIFVAAAGNEGADAPPAYPGAYHGVIAVTAVAPDLHVYARANRGPYIKFAAPGVHIWTAAPNGKARFQSGTSFAAPFVTSLVATIYRTGAAQSWEAAEAHIPRTDLGSSGRDNVFGHGLATAPMSCSNIVAALPSDSSMASAAQPRLMFRASTFESNEVAVNAASVN
jgi:subtilisin family serine protease